MRKEETRLFMACMVPIHATLFSILSKKTIILKKKEAQVIDFSKKIVILLREKGFAPL